MEAGVSDIISVVACLLAVWAIEPAEQANSLEGRKEGRKESVFTTALAMSLFSNGRVDYRRGGVLLRRLESIVETIPSGCG